MNITPQSTTVASNTQEVLLRTRASDAASLEHGNQVPAPEQLTARFAPNQTDEERPVGTHSSGLRLVIILLVLAAVGALVYFVVYPYLTAAPAPTTI